MVIFQRFLALLLAAFFCVGVLAYSASMTQMDMHHDMGGATKQLCPMMGNAPACANVFAHISHWQTTLAGTFVEMLVLVVMAFVFVRSFGRLFWYRLTRPLRISKSVLPIPTIFQELFSQGILNPKVP